MKLIFRHGRKDVSERSARRRTRKTHNFIGLTHARLCSFLFRLGEPNNPGSDHTLTELGGACLDRIGRVCCTKRGQFFAFFSGKSDCAVKVLAKVSERNPFLTNQSSVQAYTRKAASSTPAGLFAVDFRVPIQVSLREWNSTTLLHKTMDVHACMCC